MDIRAQQAREHHRRSAELAAEAEQHREQRDRLVRLLRAEDPQLWSYPALAKAVRCSPELVAYILKRKLKKTSASELTERKSG